MEDTAHTEQVRVFCRVKPHFGDEEECVKCLDEGSLSIENTQSKSKSLHTFSHVFAQESSQSEVYSECLLPYVSSVLNGDNALFFSYGVTGSGKTYTMQGSLHDPGLIPRTLDTVFNSISNYSTLKYVVKSDGHNGFDLQTEAEAIMDRQRFDYTSKSRTPNRADLLPNLEGRYVDDTSVVMTHKGLYAVFLTFVELYNDVIYDLLDESGSSGRPLHLYEDEGRNTYINGVIELEVKNANEALKAYYQGQKRRRVGATMLNKDSSRSHGIFNIRIVRAGYDTTYDEVIMDKKLLSVSQLCLVDLAGSERTARSGTTGGRLKEASTINQSLLTLRKCVEVLRINQASTGCHNPNVQQQIVPYRDCKLTRIFKSFFDGNGQVAILVCIHPTLSEYSETVHVLKFAERSQQVSTVMSVTSAKANVDHSSNLKGPSSLLVCNDELSAAALVFPQLDAALMSAVNSITASNPTDFPLNFCGCLTEEGIARRSSLRKSRRSSTRNLRHSPKCPLFSVLQERAKERTRCRELLECFAQELKTQISDITNRAESRGYLSLLAAMDKMNNEKMRMESRIRYLENEVTRQKTLVSFERMERCRDANNPLPQVNRLRGQFDTPLRKPKQSRRGSHSQASLASSTSADSAATPRRRFKKPLVIPASVSRVAALSRQWETRLAQERQESARRVAAVASTKSRSKTPMRRTARPAEVILEGALNLPPAMNPRHRRSKSVGGEREVWLEHKENNPAPLGTIFSPSSLNVRKSATHIELGDTLKATNYVLHHQTATPEGNVETKLYKGAIIPTAGGGSAVVFNDVEELRQVSPLSASTTQRRSARLSCKHALSVCEEAMNTATNEATTGDEFAPRPPSAKRRSVCTESSTRHEHPVSARSVSITSLTSGVASATSQTGGETAEEDGGSSRGRGSYHTVTPPLEPQFLGYTSTGGVAGPGFSSEF